MGFNTGFRFGLISYHILSFTRSIQEDPVRPGLIYLGTENRVYVSFNDGDDWQPFINNLPPAPMYGIVIQEHFNDLVIGTYGRGFWIMDDMTPLQQLTENVVRSTAHLFEPRAAYRFRPISTQFTMFDDQTDGDDPPYGASINYWIGADAQSAEIDIADASGEIVRTLQGTTDQGVNRIWWDLQGEAFQSVRLRTKPLYGNDFQLGEDRTRPFTAGTPAGHRQGLELGSHGCCSPRHPGRRTTHPRPGRAATRPCRPCGTGSRPPRPR